MDYQHVLEGYVLGLSVAATIGISGILCLQNMMSGKVFVGLASAFAAALADMLCAVLVVFGLQSGQLFLLKYKFLFELLAGIFLCILGLRNLFGVLIMQQEHGTNQKALAAFGAVFFLSVVDPVSIVDFMALCMGLTIDFSVMQHAIGFVGGLFLGSATWWFSLLIILLFFQKTISVATFQRIQQLVGAGIFFFGIWNLWFAFNGVFAG